MADVTPGPISPVLVFLCPYLCNCHLRHTIHPSWGSSRQAGFPHFANEELRHGLPQGPPSPLGTAQTTAPWGSAGAFFPRPSPQLDSPPQPTLFWGGQEGGSKAWKIDCWDTFGSVNSVSPFTGSVTLSGGQTSGAWSSPSGWDLGSHGRAADAPGSRVKSCRGRALAGVAFGGGGRDVTSSRLCMLGRRLLVSHPLLPPTPLLASVRPNCPCSPTTVWEVKVTPTWLCSRECVSCCLWSYTTWIWSPAPPLGTGWPWGCPITSPCLSPFISKGE